MLPIIPQFGPGRLSRNEASLAATRAYFEEAGTVTLLSQKYPGAGDKNSISRKVQKVSQELVRRVVRGGCAQSIAASIVCTGLRYGLAFETSTSGRRTSTETASK
jgi:hypothetical protein